MRICLLLPSFLPAIGGLEKAADCLATIVVSWGHEPVVLTQANKYHIETIQRPYRIHTYARSRSATWYPRTPMTALLQMHGQYRFDLIWAFQAYPTGYAAVKTGRHRSLRPAGDFPQGAQRHERLSNCHRHSGNLRHRPAFERDKAAQADDARFARADNHGDGCAN